MVMIASPILHNDKALLWLILLLHDFFFVLGSFLNILDAPYVSNWSKSPLKVTSLFMNDDFSW